jgi:hypothetical protein
MILQSYSPWVVQTTWQTAIPPTVLPPSSVVSHQTKQSFGEGHSKWHDISMGLCYLTLLFSSAVEGVEGKLSSSMKAGIKAMETFTHIVEHNRLSRAKRKFGHTV